ncbi:MAG: hypothetical protein KJ623_03010 [Nanoarchaeota archaeon]|nr:hypothetical protein [Nanoarchaeota archaeon]MBU0962390.1 hypothetical protein [Nanoarchaeota archaeon]
MPEREYENTVSYEGIKYYFIEKIENLIEKEEEIVRMVCSDVTLEHLLKYGKDEIRRKINKV